MKSRNRRIGTVLVISVLVATALAGGALAAMVAHRATATTKIAVTEKDYRIVLKKHSFAKGKVTLVIHNASGTLHQFKIKGPGLSKQISAVNPGATKKLTVTLRKGTYTLSCPLHLAYGMKTTIKAGGASGTGGTGGTSTGGTGGSTWG
jgi:plastocyanin